MRETGSEMHQNALWDCFGDAVALLQGITRFRRKLSKNSPTVKLDTRETHFHAQRSANGARVRTHIDNMCP